MLQEMGHEVACFCNYGWNGAIIEHEGVRIYPPGLDPWGGDVLARHIAHWKADVVVSFHGLWVYGPDYRDSVTVPWVGYFPVDHDPAPPVIAIRARQLDFPVVYSEFARAAMADAGVTCDFIPHTIDTSIFYPGDRGEARRRIGLPEGRFVAAIVAANQELFRKAFPEQMAAFAQFARDHEEIDPILYVHSDHNHPEGHDIYAMAEHLGIAGRLCGPDKYSYMMGLPAEFVADVYRASDVLLAAARGEGFGLPIAEAQACGCPVITTAFTAMTELTVNGVSLEPLQRMWTPLLSWQAVPGIAHITTALEQVAGLSGDERARWAERGVAFVRDKLSVAAVTPLWKGLFERVGDEIGVPCVGA